MYDDEFFMQKALQEAQLAFDEDEVPVGAIVVMQNKIIGRGHNLTETLKDPTAHAEMMALTAAFAHLGAKYLPDATIYITVEPCHMCAGALYWSKIGRIVYGAADLKNGYRRFLCDCDGKETAASIKNEHKVFHPKTILVTGILQDVCGALMTDFFQRKRKL
ncbi:MAG: nucleoside deaminase [Bacteroidota bacterium]